MIETLAARKVSRPRIVVHGGYGKHNLGDDAILEAIVDSIEARFQAAEISVVCHDPEPVRAQHPDLTAYAFRDLRVLRAALSADIYMIGGGGSNRERGYIVHVDLDLSACRIHGH